MQQLNKWWHEKPLTVVMAVGFFFRLLSVIFSKGYGFHDDHFLYIEPAQAWADHYNYNHWLNSRANAPSDPSNFSFFYPGLQFIFLAVLKFAGITDPQGKMYVIRLLHAIYSMFTIYYGYKITEKLSNVEVAKKAGLLLAILWLFPFMSVRNLVEIACIPPLIAATWLVVRTANVSMWQYFLVGILLGIGFNIRFQTILFIGGFGIVILMQKKWVPAMVIAAGGAICILVFQGGVDYLIKGEPFTQFREYIQYNTLHAHEYPNGPWYNYLLLLGGILVAPVSLCILFGYFWNFRKNLILFLPSFIFLAFHSYFPNKQERFILPIVPFIIMSGLIGWYQYMGSSNYWLKRPKLMHYFWIIFWLINTAPLLLFSFSYSKRNRVEAMTFLAKKGDATSLLIEDSNGDNPIMSPLFYLGKWVPEYKIASTHTIDSVYLRYCSAAPDEQPNYMIFYSPINKDKRLEAIAKYHTLKLETMIEPSLVDKIMYKLNPINDNQATYIYRITGTIYNCDSAKKERKIIEAKMRR